MNEWCSVALLTPINCFRIYIEKLYKYFLRLCSLWVKLSIGKALTIEIYVIVYFKFSFIFHWTQTKIIWRLCIIIIILFYLLSLSFAPLKTLNVQVYGIIQFKEKTIINNLDYFKILFLDILYYFIK